MSETDAKSLTAEERAIVDGIYLILRSNCTNGTEAERYADAVRQSCEAILARRALFAPAASEPEKKEPAPEQAIRILARHLNHCAQDATVATAVVEVSHWLGEPAPPEPAAPEPAKVECPNCREETDSGLGHRRLRPVYGDDYICKPAPPELAAPEMSIGGAPDGTPYEIAEAVAKLSRHGEKQEAHNLAGWWMRWRAHAQPVEDVAPKKLEKVRIALDTMRAHFEPNCQGQCRFPMVWTFCQEALAELDAYERGGGRG